MTTDFRALCAELSDALRNAIRVVYHEDGTQHISTAMPILRRARAALADEPAVPEGREPASVTGQPTYNELYDFFNQHTSEYMKMYANEAPSFMRAVLARWGNLKAGVTSSTPAPGEGEVAELTDKLVEAAPALAEMGWDQHAQRILRAAELLQRQVMVPVPVSERLQQMEDLAADAVAGLRYIEQSHGRLYGVGWDRVYKKADQLKPAHALPVPGQEVEG